MVFSWSQAIVLGIFFKWFLNEFFSYQKEFNYQYYLDAEKKKLKTEARELVVPDVFYNMKGPLQPHLTPGKLPT